MRAGSKPGCGRTAPMLRCIVVTDVDSCRVSRVRNYQRRSATRATIARLNRRPLQGGIGNGWRRQRAWLAAVMSSRSEPGAEGSCGLP